MESFWYARFSPVFAIVYDLPIVVKNNEVNNMVRFALVGPHNLIGTNKSDNTNICVMNIWVIGQEGVEQNCQYVNKKNVLKKAVKLNIIWLHKQKC